MQRRRNLFLVLAFFFLSLAVKAQAPAPTALKDAFRNAFFIGAAIDADQFTGKDERGDAIILQQFNSITPENVLKWEVVHPRPDAYDFTLSDKYVEFGLKNHMFIVGHNLCWHSQTPAWVFKDEKGNPLT